MQNLSDRVIVGTAALVVGVTASLVGGVGGASGALLGSSTGVVLGAAISSRRHEQQQRNQEDKIRDQQIRLRELEAQVALRDNWERMRAALPSLTARVSELRQAQTELATVEGKFVQKQAELQQVEQRLTILNQQREELERRVATINQQQPNLSHLEQLQKQIEQFSLDKSGLEGQINALHSQVKILEEKERSLNNIQTEFSTKKTQLDLINQEIQQRKTQSQQLEQRAAELELLRATYDGLFSQKQSFEERVNQLRPEINSLEAEKTRILQAIQENQQEYQRIEPLRSQLSGLKFQIKDKESQVRELDREIHHLNGIKASLEENNAQLREEKEQLHDDIRLLKGEIENLENSAEVALRALKEELWLSLPDTKQSVINEQLFLQDFTKYIQQQGLNFSQRVIHAFHTSLKVQDISALVILAGISGTGKSELPQKYAQYIGAQLLTLAVQPRWDSPQDLQGFYNYVEKKFKPTDLMRGLYQYNNDGRMHDRMVIVLLDEMNLARVEYYFSEFLSKLETRRSHPTYLEIDVGSLPLKDTERRLEIPKQFLFVGTMNEDETTQTLSDKVLDRANVLTFGKPQNLQLRQQSHSQNTNTIPSRYLPYSDFRNWMKTPDTNSQVVEKVKSYIDRVNEVMENMGHAFAHRVYQAIIQYVVNYPGVENSNSPAFKFAIADQFGQKILPKLRGVMIDEFTEELDNLERIILEINDQPLIAAFKKAREGRYGQFQWQGLVYQDEAAK